MPNWVRNEIRLSGSADALHTLLSHVEGNDQGFDFNEIIPMPESLHIVSGSSTEAALLAYSMLMGDYEINCKVGAFLATKPYYSTESFDRDFKKATELRDKWLKEHGLDAIDPELIDLSTDGIDFMEFPEETFEAYARHGKVYYTNLAEYGSIDWYDWCCDNWGTKWNACHDEIGMITETENGLATLDIAFDTAWSMPSPIFTALAETYPYIRFSGRWADEDMGRNCGLWEAENGVIAFTEDECLPNPLKLACEVWGYDYDEYVASMQTDNDEDSSACEIPAAPEVGE
jgi:hypothetical protein